MCSTGGSYYLFNDKNKKRINTNSEIEKIKINKVYENSAPLFNPVIFIELKLAIFGQFRKKFETCSDIPLSVFFIN